MRKNQYTDPYKKPFKVGQLVKMFHLGEKGGLFLVLDMSWRAFRDRGIWQVEVFEQRTGKKYHNLARVFETAEKTDV